MNELLEQTGPAILVTHSNSGQYGWAAGIEAPEGAVKAIIAFEPGQICLPEGEKLPEVAHGDEASWNAELPFRVSEEAFMKLTKFPILIVYGDNIAAEPSEIFNVNVWRLSFTWAKQFAEAINKRGGDARVLHLPEIGIKGNTHAMFADLNNLEIADIVERYLAEKQLAGRSHPHAGPGHKNIAEYTIPLK
ncbi:hypothetical protein [Cloacibacillus sp. An23]|uniref:hypothetical protein n=1 Tax=Cloacibacillus sp. An23 TaxID=1965591 RepID=UPI00194ED524|nr:hypothetical protein [Cloacibacillus sp. An23]